MSQSQESTFIDRLRRDLDGDRRRAERALLRRYWSPATRTQAYPILGQLGAIDDARKAFVATLYAENPLHQAGLGVGKAALRLGDRREDEHPYDRHFRRLLACQELGDVENPGELPQQLHRLVKRLAGEGVGLDFAELHKNLNFWRDYRDRVLLRWASEFWGAPVPSTEDAPLP